MTLLRENKRFNLNAIFKYKNKAIIIVIFCVAYVSKENNTKKKTLTLIYTQ